MAIPPMVAIKTPQATTPQRPPGCCSCALIWCRHILKMGSKVAPSLTRPPSLLTDRSCRPWTQFSWTTIWEEPSSPLLMSLQILMSSEQHGRKTQRFDSNPRKLPLLYHYLVLQAQTMATVYNKVCFQTLPMKGLHHGLRSLQTLIKTDSSMTSGL